MKGAQLSIFGNPAPTTPTERRWVPGKVYQYGSIRVVHCFRDPKRPHGEGHNAVCVCQCEDCRRERGES